MRSFSGLTLILLFGFIHCSSIAISQEISEIAINDFPGFSLTRNECFDGGSLWGYMNGGADIYLEYGFEALRVEEFSGDGETLKLELFKMEDPVSAFGIYSIKTFKCKQSDVLVTPDCLNRYQYQIVYGDFYVQLINDSGSEQAQQKMVELAELVLKKLEAKKLTLPVKYLTDSMGFSINEIKMARGRLGIQNSMMDLEDCFKGIENYRVYYASIVKDREKVKFYEIIFDTPEMKSRFLENNRDKRVWVEKEDEVMVLIRQ
ncbi:MAG: hypothetical protein KKA81_04270 [Bacteroidetes bacterium]|nr:hypothetical protein [Bacteroidota bacterium]